MKYRILIVAIEINRIDSKYNMNLHGQFQVCSQKQEVKKHDRQRISLDQFF